MKKSRRFKNKVKTRISCYKGVLIFIMLMAVVSCKDEEPAPLERLNIVEFDGYRFHGVQGGGTVEYDIEDGGQYINVAILSGKVKRYFSPTADYKQLWNSETQPVSHVEFSPQGFMTALSIKSFRSGGVSTNYTSTERNTDWIFSYDSSGHLTGWVSEQKLIMDEEKVGSSQYSRIERMAITNCVITWENENLTAVYQEYTAQEIIKEFNRVENGEDVLLYERGPIFTSREANYHIDYNNEINPLKQFSLSLATVSLDQNVSHLIGPIGLIGIGPRNLPVRIEGYDFYNTEIKGEIDIKLGEFNGLKYISSDVVNGNRVYYRYVKDGKYL